MLTTHHKYSFFGIRMLPADGLVSLPDLMVVVLCRELATKQLVPTLRAARIVLMKPFTAYFKLEE